MQRAAADLYRADGVTGLRAIDGVGEGLARTIGEIIETGRSSLFDRLAGETSPEMLFAGLPGVGTGLAHRICDELGVATLEELELAAHDGRLARVEGLGRKRVAGIRDALTGILGSRRYTRTASRCASNRRSRCCSHSTRSTVSVRRANDLPTIAPRRFNPAHEQWLPILHTVNDGWDATVLFSNTRRAHELGKTHDWVVIYYHKDHREDQCTVVTGRYGVLAGERVVRGREAECRRHYALGSRSAAASGR